MKVGYRTYVGIGDEASFGTEAQPEAFVEYDSEGLAKTRERRNIRSMNGTRHIKKTVTLAEQVGGPLAFPVMPGLFFLKLLKHAVGSSYVRSTLTTGVYQYDFVAGAISLGSSTFQVATDTDDTTGTFNYVGSQINGFNLNLAANDLLLCDLDIMGKDEVLANTIATATYPTQAPYTFVDCIFRLGDTDAAATNTCLNSWSMNLNNNYLEKNCIDGTALRTGLEPGDQEITGEVARYYENNDIYSRVINSTKTYQKLTFTGESLTAVYDHLLTIELFNTKIDPPTRGNAGSSNELIAESHPYTAIFEDASVTTLKISIITDVASITT